MFRRQEIMRASEDERALRYGTYAQDASKYTMSFPTDPLPLSVLQLDPVDRAVIRIADERDAIQKKTFTKWVNKHLLKSGRHIDDLFEGLRDGHNLVSLLEVLSQESLPRERGRMRFHKLQNVQTCLDFLKYKGIKLVNIRPDEIVDGNPKLILGLVWTIILHFQVSHAWLVLSFSSTLCVSWLYSCDDMNTVS